jgi:hypothetical protein
MQSTGLLTRRGARVDGRNSARLGGRQLSFANATTPSFAEGCRNETCDSQGCPLCVAPASDRHGRALRTLWETLETESRQIFIGQVRWMHARDELIDTDAWRVRLQHYFPVGRFGASFYVKTRERYSLAAQGETRSTAIDEM